MMRDEWAYPGTMWASVAASPSPGRSRFPTWVDWTTSPSGSVILSGLMAFCLLCIGTCGRRKWAVAPESAIAWFDVRSRLMHSMGLLDSSSLSWLDSEAVDAVAASDLFLQL